MDWSRAPRRGTGRAVEAGPRLRARGQHLLRAGDRRPSCIDRRRAASPTRHRGHLPVSRRGSDATDRLSTLASPVVCLNASRGHPATDRRQAFSHTAKRENSARVVACPARGPPVRRTARAPAGPRPFAQGRRNRPAAEPQAVRRFGASGRAPGVSSPDAGPSVVGGVAAATTSCRPAVELPDPGPPIGRRAPGGRVSRRTPDTRAALRASPRPRLGSAARPPGERARRRRDASWPRPDPAGGPPGAQHQAPGPRRPAPSPRPPAPSPRPPAPGAQHQAPAPGAQAPNTKPPAPGAKPPAPGAKPPAPNTRPRPPAPGAQAPARSPQRPAPIRRCPPAGRDSRAVRAGHEERSPRGRRPAEGS